MGGKILVRSEVRQALEEGLGVVALETAVLTHGLPYPENLQTMADMASAVRQSGAVPAVIGLYGGDVVVGLESHEWEKILPEAEKCSLRDLGPAMVRGKNGGTTVAATAYIAHRTGIRVFATGGIGGVHRGVVDTWDVSTDVYALSWLPVLIVSSGAKSILDLPKTMEFLESLGIPVVGYRTSDFPGFYVSSTGLYVSSTANHAAEAVEIERAMRELGLRQALLLVQPGPLPVDGDFVEKLVSDALAKASSQGVRGKETTPFLLNYLNQVAGDSLKRANIALLKANALLAGEVAAAFYA